MQLVVRLIELSQAPRRRSVMMAWPASMADKVGSQFRLNRFLPNCLEMKSMKDSLVRGAVVAELSLATAGVITNGGL